MVQPSISNSKEAEIAILLRILGEEPPPAIAIFLGYTVLGSALSFGFGRDPGTTLLPPTINDLATELAPTITVVCLFIVSYSLLDVMAVVIAKEKHGYNSKPLRPSLTSNPPDEVYLALRAQANQVEQLPGYLMGAICFSALVNGKVGAVLSAIWAVLRRVYAMEYRSSAGKTFAQTSLANCTIPSYFVLNSMLMGTVIQCVRNFLQ